jgi:hypothetical protein
LKGTKMLDRKMGFVRSWRGIAIAGIIGVAQLGVPATAAAQPAPASTANKTPAEIEKQMAEAKSRYKAGLTLYDDGAFDAARVQFERAYELAPTYKILYNIGLVYKQLNEFVGSLKALQKYLAEGASEVPEDRRVEVTKLIETLRPIIASAVVKVNIPGAEIAVDDAVIGKSPMVDPVFLNPGRRKVSAKFEGRLPDAKVITVASGDKADVELNLVEPPKTIVKTGSDWKPVVAWTATGVFAIGAGISAILTNGAKSDLDDLHNKRNQDAAPSKNVARGDLHKELVDQESKTKTLALITDICTGAAIVGAAVSVYLTFIRKSGDEPEKNLPVKVKTGKDSFKPTNVMFTGSGIAGQF